MNFRRARVSLCKGSRQSAGRLRNERSPRACKAAHAAARQPCSEVQPRSMRCTAHARKAIPFSRTRPARGSRYSRRMTIVLQIEGAAIDDIASLYAEINRVFMAGEAWQLGPSLDALDDLLHGSYGALAGQAQATLIWRDIAHSRTALGMETTRQWLQAKLDTPGSFNTHAIALQLQDLQRGEGPTYFEIVMQIIDGHQQITLVPA